MKNTLLLVIAISLIAACKPSSDQPKFYGKSFDTTKAITVSQMISQMQGQTRLEAVVTGQISESCQDDGCWLNLENENGSEMFVDWDHEFNLAKDISGRKIFANGYAYIDTLKPEKPVAFKATGVHL